MSKPRLLELFCGAGGSSAGYHRAGFDVTGVDVNPQPHYPFTFIQADAMTYPLDGFDAIHAGPPCDDHSSLANLNPLKGTGWMLDATRARLEAHGAPWVIENVETAPMPGSLVLCGTEFGLTTRTDLHGEVWLRRHRRFWSSVFLWGAGGCHCRGRQIVSVHGGGAGGSRAATRGKGLAKAARELMGIDWMTTAELDKAIPPAYTQFIGTQILEAIGARVG